MIKYGTVTEIDADRAMVRVNFDEDAIVSPWLAVSVSKSMDDQDYGMPDPKEHVWCIMDEKGASGIVGGAIYSQDRMPTVKGANIKSFKFKDGTIFKYDRDAHRMTVTMNSTELIVDQDGYSLKRGGETLKKIISDTLDELIKLTVTTPVGPSGIPINAAAFTAIKTRISNLLK